MDIYGILAHPAKHSLSPIMHNAAFKELGIDAEYKYFDIEEKKLSNFVDKVRKENIKGFNISKPHKITIMKFLDEIDETARIIGAVNTVKNIDGKLFGTNFDWIGVQGSINEITNIKEKNVVILGAGGAARASVYACKKNEAKKIIILNRTIEKAEELSKEFNCEYGEISDFNNFEADIVIQATSAGMNNPEGVEIIPKEHLKPSMVAMELIYTPLMTKILKDAKEIGAKIITGENMLLHQGYACFELWTGEKAPRETMRNSIKPYLK